MKEDCKRALCHNQIFRPIGFSNPRIINTPYMRPTILDERCPCKLRHEVFFASRALDGMDEVKQRQQA